MLVRYINQDKKGEQNVTIAVPMVIESCCSDCAVWFFKNVLDIVIKEAMFVKRNMNDPKDVEIFVYCQFCGKRHRTEEMAE